MKEKEKTVKKGINKEEYAERMVNLSDVKLTAAKRKLLEEELKYAPLSSINKKRHLLNVKLLQRK